MDELPLFNYQSQAQAKAKAEGSGLRSDRVYWTVSELTSKVRGILEPAFTQVWVQGEISNHRPATSGHAYFSLKDQNASVAAAIFGWGSRAKTFKLKDGLQVLCRGKLTIYPPRGSYQLTVDHIEPLGVGALQLALEELKTKLGAEGLFEQARKRKLPVFPAKIAVVTSPTGSVIQDMLNILKRRAPHVKVTIIPALVQGEAASAQLIRGLQLANQHGLGDLVVLARGGGSMEDLWCFNNEALVRAIAGSALPVISAVGHETDFTIADFVADLRAPTPSAAAEIISGGWVDAVSRIGEAKTRLRGSVSRNLAARKVLLSHVAARVISPKDKLREQAQRCDELSLRFLRTFQTGLERRKNILVQCIGKLDALSPLRVLERGYSIVREMEPAEVVIKSAKQIKAGQELRVTFYDGQTVVRAL